MPRAQTRPVANKQAASRPFKSDGRARPARQRAIPRPLARARRKFLRAFPGGFRDETYLDWERDYKWTAHQRWCESLNEPEFRRLLRTRAFEEIARRASAIESRTNLLFSFEKMALRDAIRSHEGACSFATALYDLLHGDEPLETRFEGWVEALAGLPRRQTRVLTWPLATVFGFIAQPKQHFFFKPTVTREALRRCGVPFDYATRPSWPVYRELLQNVKSIRTAVSDMRPQDMIDMQSFLWVQGSDEYPD